MIGWLVALLGIWLLLAASSWVSSFSFACSCCGTVICPICCPGSTCLPTTLTLTFGAIGGSCAFLSGTSFTLTYQLVGATHTWQNRTANACSCGFLNFQLSCNNGTGAFTLRLSTDAPCNGQLNRGPDAGFTCSPPSFSFSGANAFDLGNASVDCCGTSPQNVSVTITA